MLDVLSGRVPLRARWPLRIFLGSLLLLGLGLVLFGPGSRPWLLGLSAFSGAIFLWTLWDETRGDSARLEALRQLWSTSLKALRNGDDLHLMQDGQPLILRLALDKGVLSSAVLTPLSENTSAFRIGTRHHPKPTFTGLEADPSGPPVEPLPGLGTLLGPTLAIEGNQPAQLARWLDTELVSAVISAERDHPQSFRGLTFDGRFLAVHWRGDVNRDPASVLALSNALWRPFVPRLPPIRAELLN